MLKYLGIPSGLHRRWYGSSRFTLWRALTCFVKIVELPSEFMIWTNRQYPSLSDYGIVRSLWHRLVASSVCHIQETDCCFVGPTPHPQIATQPTITNWPPTWENKSSVIGFCDLIGGGNFIWQCQTSLTILMMAVSGCGLGWTMETD